METMKAQGKCPDCRGYGVQPLPVGEVFAPIDNCPSCQGSGAYSDWVEGHDEFL